MTSWRRKGMDERLVSIEGEVLGSPGAWKTAGEDGPGVSIYGLRRWAVDQDETFR
jgi:hypothetical protein